MKSIISIKSIKKIISTAMAGAVALTAFSAVMPQKLNLFEEVSAEHGDNGVYFYDFEDYTASFGAGQGPDEHLKTVKIWDGTKENQFNYKNYGAGTDPETDSGHNGVMIEKSASFPSFQFPNAITKGKMKISFDMKVVDPNNKSAPCFWLYGGIDDKLDRTTDEMHLLWFNYGGNGLARYAKYCAAWNATNPLNDFDYEDAKQWNHYDFVFSEASSASTPIINGYINGKLAFEGTLRNNAAAKSIRTFGIWMEGGDSESRVYVDNFYAKHFMGKDVFTADTYGDNTFDINDGKIRIAMTERSEEPITKDNISVTNVTTGKPVTNFDVVNYTGQSFDIQINGKVDYGRHDINFKNVKGELTGDNISGSVTAYTEYKSIDVQTSTSIDFNDYNATDGSLPQGFENLEGETELYATSVVGKNGNGDYALGFSGIPSDDWKTRRVMNRFESPVDGMGGLEISFDLYNKDSVGYFYLAENDDFDTTNNNYKKNALISVDSDGELYYAKNRTASPTDTVSGVNLTPGQWHNIKVRVEGDAENDKTYLYISADGGTEQKVETNRRIDKTSVAGIGVGCMGTGYDDSEPEVKIDNIKLIGKVSSYYPQVETIKAYDGLGNQVTLTGEDSAMISELRIKFNTYVNHNLDGLIKVTEDGKEIPLSYEVTDNRVDYTSTVSVKFENLLSRLREYNVSVSAGVPSAYNDDIKSYISYSTDIVANNDVGFKCGDHGYDDANGSATVVFSKNDSSAGKYIYAIAGFKTVTKQTEDGEIQVKQMTGMKYIPIDITADNMGRFEYTVEYKDNNAMEYKTFLWKYPKTEKLEYSKDGTIE